MSSMKNSEKHKRVNDLDLLCLSRTDWILSLHPIFCFLSNSLPSISSAHFTKSLASSVQSDQFPLTETSNYSKPEQFITCSQVIQKLNTLPSQVTWDQVLDCLVSAPLIRAKKTEFKYPPASEQNTVSMLNESLLDLNPSILYLNLSSSAIEVLPKYPQTLRILNLSNNVLSSLTIESGVEYLNCKQNLIQKISVFPNSSLKELYINDNKLTSCSSFQFLQNLRLLDLSENLIELCEDVALLVQNTKLQVLSLRDNPFYGQSSVFVSSIFRTVLALDPEKILEHSKCPRLDVLIGMTEACHKRNFTLPLDFSKMPTSRGPCKAFNQANPSGNTSPTGFTSVNKSVSYNYSPLSKENIDRRPFRSSQRRSTSTLVTPQSIAKSANITYGNPIAALMIKPSEKRRISRKPRYK